MQVLEQVGERCDSWYTPRFFLPSGASAWWCWIGGQKFWSGSSVIARYKLTSGCSWGESWFMMTGQSCPQPFQCTFYSGDGLFAFMIYAHGCVIYNLSPSTLPMGKFGEFACPNFTFRCMVGISVGPRDREGYIQPQLARATTACSSGTAWTSLG